MRLITDTMTQPLVDYTHGSLPERTYERIRELIVRGRLASGTRIVEAEIALRFGVSRTPVREALARLVLEQYLMPVSDGRRTEVVVAPFAASDVRELWGMIGALEGKAVSLVAGLPLARREKIARDLRVINARLKRAANTRPRDPDELFELQAAFHLCFVHEIAGPHLRRVYDSIRPHVQRYEWVYGTRVDAEYEPSTNEHMKIIAAIRAGDPDRARSAVITHWDKATARTVAIITTLPEPPADRGPRVKAHLAPRKSIREFRTRSTRDIDKKKKPRFGDSL